MERKEVIEVLKEWGYDVSDVDMVDEVHNKSQSLFNRFFDGDIKKYISEISILVALFERNDENHGGLMSEICHAFWRLRSALVRDA